MISSESSEKLKNVLFEKEDEIAQYKKEKMILESKFQDLQDILGSNVTFLFLLSYSSFLYIFFALLFRLKLS